MKEPTEESNGGTPGWRPRGACGRVRLDTGLQTVSDVGVYRLEMGSEVTSKAHPHPKRTGADVFRKDRV